MDPDAFSELRLSAVLRGGRIIVVPAWWSAAWNLERLSPNLSVHAAKQMLTRMHRLNPEIW
jgi:hypothetical protein